jgi:hypothetical protein
MTTKRPPFLRMRWWMMGFFLSSTTRLLTQKKPGEMRMVRTRNEEKERRGRT